MRFLLISDTHGKLALINTLAGEIGAEAVIHAGDFGFFDEESADRLSDRELRLQIVHSSLPHTEKDRILAQSRHGMVEAVRRHRLLGEFQSLLDGNWSLDVPVYALWGNHEDIHVIRRLHRGEIAIENLNIVDHRRGYRAGPALLYGLGGNLLLGSKMLHRSLAGGAGKVWSTLSQYRELVELADEAERSPGPRVFLSHVSPGKEPFVELVAARTRSELTVSGHMGAPGCMVWNSFAVSSPQEAEKRLREGLASVEQRCLAAAPSKAAWIAESLGAIGSVLEDSDVQGKGAGCAAGEPRWFRGMTHVNLPDAHVGHAVLDVGETGWKLQTHSR
jgi:predicted phosphodiesterase